MGHSCEPQEPAVSSILSHTLVLQLPQLHKDQTYPKFCKLSKFNWRSHSHSDNILIRFYPEEIYVQKLSPSWLFLHGKITKNKIYVKFLIPIHRSTCKLTVIYMNDGVRNGRDHLYICEKAEAHPLCTFVSSSYIATSQSHPLETLTP